MDTLSPISSIYTGIFRANQSAFFQKGIQPSLYIVITVGLPYVSYKEKREEPPAGGLMAAAWNVHVHIVES
jgi:hypothetical protein